MTDAMPPSKFEDADETIEEAATATSNMEEDSAMCEPHDSSTDKTSADYYFDSYSHFGN
ncbi:hypothetical protein HanOQP8_Chr03g0086441 [Helianthus annuus]|nr:hypothetical protein HanOQP8_Chr03g0086441 [Helianthus annuus]